MKNTFKTLLLATFALLFFYNNIQAQAPFKYLTYIFPSDSLRGYDENTAKQIAFTNGYFGSEYHVFMYTYKRNFINNKYNLNPNVNPWLTAKPGPNTINSLPCINEDFEASPLGIVTSTLLGWSIAEGQNNWIGTGGSCAMNGCCPTFPTNNAWIVNTPLTGDPVIGTVPVSPLGGTKVLKMNDNITNKGEVVRIQQTFPVTSSNALFQFAYMAALNGTGHTCCSQPYLRFTLMDCMNNIVACPQVSITPPGPSCATVASTGWTTNTSGYSYTTAWKVSSIDLSPYMGTCITVQITVGDCDGWAHFGYAYVDCVCKPMTITVNNVQFPAGTSAVAVAACGALTGTLVAPPGLGPYSWQGPTGSGITANPNQTITTAMAGNYTLTMNPLGVCVPITKTVTLTFGTFPTAGFTAANSCTTYSFTNTGTGPPSVQSYSFAGGGAPANYTTTSSVSSVNFAPSTTYTVYQTVTNPAGCPATASMVITTPPGPSPAFTASPSYTQCLIGNSFTFNATTAAGTHTWTFNSPVGAPPSGFTNNYGPVAFTAAGTYTVTHTINSAGCVSSTSSLVVVNVKPTAVASATPPACSGGAALLVGSGGPGTITWAGPAGWIGIGASASISSFSAANVGIYTLTVNNFGCITTQTVSLSIPPQPTVTAAPTISVCIGQTINLNAILTNTSTTYAYWSGPGGFFWNQTAPTMTNATTASSGVYYFYVGFTGGCWAQTTTTVSVIPTPTANATNTGPYCLGAPLQLNGFGPAGATYTWTGPSTFSSNIQNPSQPVTTMGMAGTYSMTLGVGACKVTKTTTVVINPLPTPTVGSNSPVCVGSSILLTAIGGTAYVWSGPNAFTSAVQNPTITNAAVINGGVYTVTVTNATGCKGTATVNVVITTPTTTATNTGPYCVGQTIQLNTPAGTTYTWTGPLAYASSVQNPTIALATAAMSGVYTVTTTTSGCKATSTTSVTVNALPTPTATNTGPYCVGATIQLNVNASSTYTWSGPNTFTSNTQSPTITSASLTSGGVYTIAVTNANGCSNTSTTTVVMNAIPTVTAGSNSPVCLGNAINLTSGGATTYSWSGPNAYTAATQNPTITTAALINGGVYTVTATTAGCSSTATVNVIISAPTTSASNTGPYCAGSTIQLNAPAATSYTWSGPAAFTSNLQNPTQALSTVAMSGIYTISVSIGTCKATATTSVTVNALPTPTATNTGPYCVGTTIQLNVNASTTYTWSGPSAFSSNTQNPNVPSAALTNAGMYALTVTDANGCTNTATTNVVVNPAPTPTVGSNSPVCINSTINLTASGGTGYVWSGPNAFASAVQNPNIPTATAINSGVYTVTVTALGCTSTGTVNVIVTTPTTSASNPGPFCLGSPIQLNSIAATSYTWSGPVAFASNLQNPTQPVATMAMAGTYSVIVSIGTCTAAATTTVVINALPTPTAGNTGPYCPGNTIQLNGSTATSYTWSGPAAFSANTQNPNISSAAAANAGTYTITVTDANGCTNNVTTNVVVNPLPTPIVGSNSPVCLNTTINLTAVGGTGYSWSGPGGFTSVVQNPNVPAATLVNAGVYTVTVTALGCTNTGTVNVTVLTPTTTASNTGAYCAGATVQLNTPAATSYTWSGPSAFVSNLQNPTLPISTIGMSGNYTVIVSAGTCTALATTSVTVNALPTPTITSNSPVCVGQPINFTGPTATTYTWSGPAVFTSNIQSPNIPSAVIANAGTYTLDVTDANGCKNNTTTNVVVNTLPIIAVNNPTACVNTPINLTSAGGATYSWSGPGGFTSVLQNPNIPSATAAMGGTYTVTVTSAQGCINTAVANVAVIALPVPTAITGGAVCIGATLNLNSSGGSSYSWSGPGGFTSALQNPNIPTTTLANGGVYTVIVTAGSCSASAVVTATINPLPIPLINTNSPVCIGQSISINGNGGVSYSWSGPGGFNSTSQNPTIPVSVLSNGGTYILTVTDGNGCVNSTNTSVIVNPLPNATAIGGTACEGANATLSANGGSSYNWTGPGGFTSTQQNPTLVSLTTGNAGIYNVTVTSVSGCTNTAAVTVVVNPAPVANINTNSPVCLNNILSFSGSGGVSYAWTGPMGPVSSASTFTLMGNSVSLSGTYVLTVTDVNGCKANASAPAIVNPLPVPAIISSPNKGCAPLCVTFTATSNPQVASANWIMGDGSYSNGVLTTERCYMTAGIFTLSASVVDVNGCQGTATYTVETYPKPTADFNYDPIKPIEGIDIVNFTDASFGATIATWNWYFMSNAQYTSNQQNPNFLYTEAGPYPISLVVTSDKGCKDTIVISILVGEDFGIYVPNAFTPNDDGLNDTFYPKGFGITKYELNIYDRWGEKVFTTNDFNEAWDGAYQNRGDKLIQEGVYTWMINVTNVFGKSKEFTGHVTLIK